MLGLAADIRACGKANDEPVVPCFSFAFWPRRVELRALMRTPTNVQVIGNEVAIVWDDGAESYFDFETLRAASPSAANQGERDILGNQYGGGGPKKFPGVQVVGWERVGNYALRFDFSDGHNSGLYSFDYLRHLADAKR